MGILFGRLVALVSIIILNWIPVPAHANNNWPSGCYVNDSGDYICGSYVPAAPTPPPTTTVPSAARYNFCSMYARYTMTGQQLYNLMQQLPNELVKYQFFSSTVGMGSGANDLQAVMRDQRFGGSQTQLNQWINYNAYDGNGNFNPVTGCYSYISSTIGSGSGCLSSWSCPPGP